jgi:hypothetical protein
MNVPASWGVEIEYLKVQDAELNEEKLIRMPENHRDLLNYPHRLSTSPQQTGAAVIEEMIRRNL